MFAFLRRRSLEADFAALRKLRDDDASGVLKKQIDDRFVDVDNNLGTINTRLDDLEMKIEAAANTGCKCVIA